MSPWNFPGQSNFGNLGQRILAAKYKAAQEAMKVVIEQAVQDMKDYTSSRPSRKSGKEGRIETSAMLEAIAGKTFTDGAYKIVGEFGFLDLKELYFALQTSTGFNLWTNGEFIEPTYAMRDAAITAVQSLMEKLGES